MAVDEAILEETSCGNARPTLRLYAWQPPCLSLGYAQPVADADIRRLEALGWDLVRRPTGGRAILHADELTYSVTGPQSEPRLAGGILESYRRLSLALLSGLQSLNIPAQSALIEGAAEHLQTKGPVCFEVPSNYEITVNGKKLIGSAQARKHEGVLQHGTLPLWGDLARITQALCFEDEHQRDAAASRLISRATTVEAVLNDRVEWETAAQAFVSAFEQTLNLTLVHGELTPQECKRVDELIVEKYANPSWTGKA